MSHFLLKVAFPDTIEVPQGTRAVWAKPKKGWQHLDIFGNLLTSDVDWDDAYAICFIPKWPTGLNGVAISYNSDGFYVLHHEMPEFSTGNWRSANHETLNTHTYEEAYLPQLKIGECFFRPKETQN